jgi:hypothetical protein
MASAEAVPATGLGRYLAENVARTGHVEGVRLSLMVALADLHRAAAENVKTFGQCALGEDRLSGLVDRRDLHRPEGFELLRVEVAQEALWADRRRVTGARLHRRVHP